MMSRRRFLILTALFLAFAIIDAKTLIAAQPDAEMTSSTLAHSYEYKITNVYPHDKSAYTQGLIYDGSRLYESTGLYGRSTLRQVELETGRVLLQNQLPKEYFAEGIVAWNDRIIQLTWQSNIGFVYNSDNLSRIGYFPYPRDGWGITCDGKRLIASDGSATLYFLNPDTFGDEGSIEVRDGSTPVGALNELEYINGELFANIYLTSRIAIISPETGAVKGWIDLQDLVEREKELDENVGVLNGIAYDPARNRLFVTGKFWPELFEIELIESS